jgi:hypothetical protein
MTDGDVQLDDQLVMYFDEPSQRIVFYDFEDDVGLSLSLAEWAKVVTAIEQRTPRAAA